MQFSGVGEISHDINGQIEGKPPFFCWKGSDYILNRVFESWQRFSDSAQLWDRWRASCAQHSHCVIKQFSARQYKRVIKLLRKPILKKNDLFVIWGKQRAWLPGPDWLYWHCMRRHLLQTSGQQMTFSPLSFHSITDWNNWNHLLHFYVCSVRQKPRRKLR